MRKKNRFPKYIAAITLCMTALFASMGAGYAYWSNTLGGQLGNYGTVSSGNIAMKFTSLQEENCFLWQCFPANDPNVSINIAPDGQRATITISKATPGSSYAFSYTIKNTGNLPVKYWLTPKYSGSVSFVSTKQTDGDLAYYGNIQPMCIDNKCDNVLCPNKTVSGTFQVYLGYWGPKEHPMGSFEVDVNFQQNTN